MLPIGFELKFHDYKRTANSPDWGIEQEPPDLHTTIPRLLVNLTISLYIITTANLEMTLDTFYLSEALQNTFYSQNLQPLLKVANAHNRTKNNQH